MKFGTQTENSAGARNVPPAYGNSDLARTSGKRGPGPWIMGAKTLIGDKVIGMEGESLGTIEDIMLDAGTGQVAYAVLSFGGFLGMGDKLFAIPWETLQLDTDNKRFMLDIDKDRLEAAPGFDKDNWPTMVEASWANSIHEFYATPPYWER